MPSDLVARYNNFSAERQRQRGDSAAFHGHPPDSDAEMQQETVRVAFECLVQAVATLYKEVLKKGLQQELTEVGRGRCGVALSVMQFGDADRVPALAKSRPLTMY